MEKTKYSLGYRNSYVLQQYRCLLSIFTGFIVLLMMSNTAFAIATNPGAVCSNSFSQGSFTNADYSSLASAINSNNYVNIAGDAAGSIPLQIRMTLTERNGPPTTGSFNSITVGTNGAFNIIRDFPSVTSVTSIDFDFRNRITEQPIFLTNVALSAFDIDYANNANNSFDDYVLFTGITASGNTIDGAFQSLEASGSNIRAFRDSRADTTGLGLYTVNTNTLTECPGTNLDTGCQGSVQFSEPVKSVKVRYSNANFRLSQTNPTNQQIFFRVDNYCYVPQYIFSGTVFDDNGGITATQANAANDDITSSSSIYTNKPNYFNGIFNSPQESGISGSTVKLVNCANTATTYATQIVNTGAPIGQYQFSVPLATFNNNTNICLVEEYGGTTYPIRTTSDNRSAGFTTTTYLYPNNDFGRVIAANAALVLKKAQYINNCPSTLNYTDSSLNTANNSDPKTGFSTGSISNMTPGQCIAYRITATNRANIGINNFIMKDVLQKQGVNGATVTSVLTNPPLSTTDYTISENPAIGVNGEIKTKSLTLASRSKRDFYFNTKYGTTVDTQ